MTVLTVSISWVLFGYVMKREEDRSWRELRTTAQTVGEEFRAKFEDEVVKLHLVQNIMLDRNLLTAEDVELLYLDQVQENTIFSRIDILYPDNTIISNGKEVIAEDLIAFDQLKTTSERMTERKIDFLTGEPCVYYIVPVVDREEVAAMVVGVIQAKELPQIFHPAIYNGEANICIIDSHDGNYLMDSWHEELGNVHTMGDRERLRGYEDVNFAQDIKCLKTGAIAFVSRTTGENLYMFYTPIHLFDWELCIFATEGSLFPDLLALRKVFFWAGLIEAGICVLYCGWNLHMIKRLQRSNAEIVSQKKQLEYLLERDVLTSLYNRHKYSEMLTSLKEETLRSVGVLYIDLNGLKQINDRHFHEEGDRYICAVARILTETFGEHCYRIGGDEFAVLILGMEQDRFAVKIQEFRTKAEENQVSVSLGAAWQQNCEELEAMFMEAEKQMYEEKRKYYEVHDRRKR